MWPIYIGSKHLQWVYEHRALSKKTTSISFFLKMLVALKRADWDRNRMNSARMKFNRRNRRGCVPGVSGRRRRPWRWPSSSWRVPCRWRRHGSRSRGTPWEHREFPRRWDRRCAWHRHDGQDDGWPASWCPGCCHAKLCDGVWRLPFRVLCLLCRDQSFWTFRWNQLRENGCLHLGSAPLYIPPRPVPHWSERNEAFGFPLYSTLPYISLHE